MGGKDTLCFRLRHREYLQDVVSTAAWAVTEYNINAGLADSFPFLGKIGANFEKYVFRSLRFMFIPAVSANTQGSIFMATDPDSTDGPFTSKEIMASYPGYTKINVWNQLVHDSLASRNKFVNQWFTRYSAIPSGETPKLYDVGNFGFACVDGLGNVNMGELYVEYDVDLLVPRIPSVLGSVGGLVYERLASNPYPCATADVLSDVSTNINSVFPTRFYNNFQNNGIYTASVSGHTGLQFTIPGVYEIVWSVWNVGGVGNIGTGAFTTVTSGGVTVPATWDTTTAIDATVRARIVVAATGLFTMYFSVFGGGTTYSLVNALTVLPWSAYQEPSEGLYVNADDLEMVQKTPWVRKAKPRLIPVAGGVVPTLRELRRDVDGADSSPVLVERRPEGKRGKSPALQRFA